MSERVVVPGGRDVRGVREGPESDRIVVCCPPHPRMGGSRSDPRIRAVSDSLADRGLASLRFDYGPWDEGRGEVADAVAALRWARERYDAVGLAGYSFGGGVALLAASESEPDALAVLAPVSTVGDRDAAATVASLSCPLAVVYGERDDTADWRAVVDAVRDRGGTVEALDADHFFVGRREQVGGAIAALVEAQLS